MSQPVHVDVRTLRFKVAQAVATGAESILVPTHEALTLVEAFEALVAEHLEREQQSAIASQELAAAIEKGYAVLRSMNVHARN